MMQAHFTWKDVYSLRLQKNPEVSGISVKYQNYEVAGFSNVVSSEYCFLQDGGTFCLP